MRPITYAQLAVHVMILLLGILMYISLSHLRCLSSRENISQKKAMRRLANERCQQGYSYLRPPKQTHPSPLTLSMLKLVSFTPYQIWSSVEGYRTRDPRVSTTGSEPGLVSLWKFDEGRGTVSVDSAAWRSSERGGITRFGVLSPAVAEAAPASSLLLDPSLFPNTAGSEQVPERPDAPAATWAISTAPVGILVRSDDGRPIFARVAGTDAHAQRPLQAVLTQVPSGGTLSVAAPVGQSSTIGVDGEEQTEAALSIGDAIPVGTRLLYRPDEGAHDPWLGGSVGEYGGVSVVDWAAEGDPHDWFRYRVETEGGEEVSTNEAVVALSVRPSLNPARLDWPLKVSVVEKLLTCGIPRKRTGMTVISSSLY